MIDLLKPLISAYERVILLGFGREGKSTYQLLRRCFPQLSLMIADANVAVKADLLLQKDAFLSFSTGLEYQEALKDKALIFKSPGVKLVGEDLHPESLLTSQTDLFIQKYHRQMIGVSGTKGKSTTATLVAYLLKSVRKNAVLLGNIGIPAFDKLDEILPETWIVYELSAHQLQFTQHSPHIAILLNVFPEHLDYFASLEDYRQSKMNLFRAQFPDDFLIIPESLNDYTNLGDGCPIVYSLAGESDSNIRFNATEFSVQGRRFSFPLLHLKGMHNKSNVLAAMLAVAKTGVELDEMLEILPDFKGLPHRLEFVGEMNGVMYYNDSISTIPQSCRAAVEALGNVGSLILGGFDRGLDYTELVHFLESTEIECFVFVGGAGLRMNNLFNSDSKKRLLIAENFDLAVGLAKKHAPVGTICLLSPAAASYDEFKNFEHRGDRFKQLVLKIT